MSHIIWDVLQERMPDYEDAWPVIWNIVYSYMDNRSVCNNLGVNYQDPLADPRHVRRLTEYAIDIYEQSHEPVLQTV